MKKVFFIFLFLLLGSINAYSFKEESVFSSGAWYKLSVVSTDNDINLSGAVYKIDYSLLQGMGINPSSIDPKHIKIYGGKVGGVLPQSLTSETIDDLEELAIYIEGEEDGSFGTSDSVSYTHLTLPTIA